MHDLASGERLPDSDVALAERNRDARGIWSDGVTMWVLDGVKDALFAYRLEAGEDSEDELERNRDEEFPNTVLSRA